MKMFVLSSLNLLCSTLENSVGFWVANTFILVKKISNGWKLLFSACVMWRQDGFSNLEI